MVTLHKLPLHLVKERILNMQQGSLHGTDAIQTHSSIGTSCLAGKLYSFGRGIRIRGRKIANSTARAEKVGKTNLIECSFDANPLNIFLI